MGVRPRLFPAVRSSLLAPRCSVRAAVAVPLVHVHRQRDRGAGAGDPAQRQAPQVAPHASRREARARARQLDGQARGLQRPDRDHGRPHLEHRP